MPPGTCLERRCSDFEGLLFACDSLLITRYSFLVTRYSSLVTGLLWESLWTTSE